MEWLPWRSECVIAALQLKKNLYKILSITLLLLHVNFPNGINTSVSIYLPNSIAVGVRLHAIRIPNRIAPRDRIIRPARTTDTTGII